MAYVHEQSFPGQPDRDSIQASATAAETQTKTESAGLPPHRRHRGPWILALAAAVAFGGGGAAAFVFKGKGGGDSDPESGKGGTAGGLAPAVSPSPSRHGLTSGTAGTRGTMPSPAASKSKTGSAAAATPARSATTGASYDSKPKFDCTGLDVSRDGDTLRVKPKVTKRGNPNPANFVTVADYLRGAASEPDNHHHVYSAIGFGSAVDIKVPADLNWQDDAATVFVAYHPGGNIPSDPNELSIQAGGADRFAAACGNAVLTWAQQTDQMGGLGGHG